MLKCQSEPMNFPLSISPSKEMGNSMEQRKTSLISGRVEPSTNGFDRPLVYWLSYKVKLGVGYFEKM